jgi:hypothetical protein
MHKVKGHSGDKFNDKADLLAKQAQKEAQTDLTTRIQSNITFNTSSINFLPTWNNLTIETHLRKFFKFCSSTLDSVYWSFLNRVKDRFIDLENRINETYIWKIQWAFFDEIRNHHCFSMKDSNLHSFIIKLSHNTLPL